MPHRLLVVLGRSNHAPSISSMALVRRKYACTHTTGVQSKDSDEPPIFLPCVRNYRSGVLWSLCPRSYDWSSWNRLGQRPPSFHINQSSHSCWPRFRAPARRNSDISGPAPRNLWWRVACSSRLCTTAGPLRSHSLRFCSA